MMEQSEQQNQSTLEQRVYNDIIQPSLIEIVFGFISCFNYRLTQDELSLYRSLQCTFSRSFLSSTHDPSDTLYNNVKHLADKVFVNDNDYTDLMNRQNETEKRTKLLNYMGFFFEHCHNDVLGVGTVMNDILNYATSKVTFVNAVRSMVNKRKYPFGQIFGKLVHAVKMYMYLDTDSERLKYKQQGMNITMSRKEMKYFVKYLKDYHKKEHIVYDIICDMFVHLEKEISDKDLTLYSDEYTNIQNKIILDSLQYKSSII